MSRFIYSDYDLYKIITTFEHEYALDPVSTHDKLLQFITDIVEFVDYELRLYMERHVMKRIIDNSFLCVMESNVGNVVSNISVKFIVNTIFDTMIDYL